jgi:hypothetical protein
LPAKRVEKSQHRSQLCHYGALGDKKTKGL